ncbi:UNVERIFIED_CONTAM: hypothetical protein GTU68_058278 [Idotea baltica]|nr:hypothetical protein [Idotea baltica]
MCLYTSVRSKAMVSKHWPTVKKLSSPSPMAKKAHKLMM